MTSRWFLSNITAIHESLHWTGSHITDRALYPFIFSIFTSVFHPNSFSNPICLRLWRNTLFFTSIQEARKRIIQASLIIPVFVLAGLISLIVEDLDLLPHQRRLSPLLGGSVVQYGWRDPIHQSGTRNRRRVYRSISALEILEHQCRIQAFDGPNESHTTYPEQKISDLVCSLDVLEMNSLFEMFNKHQSSMNLSVQAEITRLNSITKGHSKMDPVLSSMETLLYNSVVPQVVMESVYLSKDEASMPIVIDTGASRSISPHKSDFIKLDKFDMDIGTINASSKVEGTGMVRWKVTDQHGVASVIETAAYYIPSANIRLYSPQYHFRENCGGNLKMDNVGLLLTLPGNRRRPALSFPYNSVNNLPLMLQSHHPHFTSAMFSACPSGEELHSAIKRVHPILKDVPVVEHFDLLATADAMDQVLINGDQRANLSTAQLELRMIHNKMGHVHMKRIQRLIHHEKPLDSKQSEGELNSPVVFRSRFAKTKTCPMPLCRACALGKSKKKKTNTQHHINDPNREMALQREHLTPGACISWDQYVVPHRGRLYTSAGR